MLEEESGLPGGEESTCKGPSSSSFTSDGVCKGAALEAKEQRGEDEYSLSHHLK